MKRVIAIFLVLLFTGCKGQEREEQEGKSEENKEMAEQPKGQWEVKKEYDDQGNLIEYDSIYTYSFKNIKGDSIRVNLDSIMDSFKGYFGEHRPFNWKDGFSYFPKQDSLFMKDFFRDDYFFNRWGSQPMDMDGMIKRMDSIRNAFMRKYHPGLMESKKNN